MNPDVLNSPLPPAVPDHELLRCIGRGSYGEVWLARSVTGAWRAIKVIHRRAGENEKAFEREYRGIQNYEPISREDPSLMQILHVGRSDAADLFYYVMELADDATVGQASRLSGPQGKSLTEETGATPVLRYAPATLKSDLQQLNRLSCAECVRLGIALASALKVLHEHGLVHRDIKPSNIIFVKGRPKLADIGLVAPTDATVSFVGTAGYLAPEGPGLPPADLYSLGKVLYEASTGKDRHLFPEPLTELEPRDDADAWAELNEVILKACERDPAKRYPSAAAMRADLLLIEAGHSVRRQRAMERWVKIAAAIIAALILLGLAGYFVQRSRLAVAAEKQQLAEAQSKERQRQLLIQRLQAVRLMPHENYGAEDWSDRAWNFASNAAAIRVDDELLSQAAATLAGLEVRFVKKSEISNPTSIRFDRGGKRLVIGTQDKGAVIWTSDLESVAQFSTGPGMVNFDFNDQAQLAMFGSNSIRLYSESSIVTPLREFTFSDRLSADVSIVPNESQIKLTPDGTFLAAVIRLTDGTSRLAVWKAESGERLLEFTETATTLALSSDGSLLASAREDGQIVVREITRGTQIMSLKASDAAIHCLVFHKNTHLITREPQAHGSWLLAAGDSSGTVVLWDLTTRIPRAYFRGSHYDVTVLAFSPDGSLLASAGRGRIKLWSVANERLLISFGYSDFHTDLAFSRDGKRLAASWVNSHRKGEVVIWNLESDRGIQLLQGLSSQVSKVCFSANGRVLAALSHNWEIGVWDLPSGDLRLVIEAPRGEFADNAAIAINSEGTQLAFSADRNARLWDLTRQRKPRVWELPQGNADLMGFHRSDKLLLFRQENASGIGQENNLGERPSQRVCRIRDLLAADPLKPLAEITDFNVTVFNGVTPLDARFFAMEGLSQVNEKRVRWLKVFDGVTGAELWSTPLTNKPNYANLAVDPKGNLLAYNSVMMSPTVETTLVESSSWKAAKRLTKYVNALSLDESHERLFSQSQDGLSYSVSVTANGQSVAEVQLDVQADSLFPQFNLAGTHLAWGNNDGTVTLCDLNKIQQRLASLFGRNRKDP